MPPIPHIRGQVQKERGPNRHEELPQNQQVQKGRIAAAWQCQYDHAPTPHSMQGQESIEDPGLHTSHLWTIWMRSVSDEHGVGPERQIRKDRPERMGGQADEMQIGEKGALVHRVGANEGMV